MERKCNTPPYIKWDVARTPALFDPPSLVFLKKWSRSLEWRVSF